MSYLGKTGVTFQVVGHLEQLPIVSNGSERTRIMSAWFDLVDLSFYHLIS
ncbi:hypothetical protein [Leuconostoc lactis]|nr:hypothetical protein [Leuconostoc lactis]